MIEISENDYGYNISVTLYKKTDSTSAENLTSASSVTLDICRLDETPICNDKSVTIDDAENGVVYFTPESTWFTSSTLNGQSHYVAIFKVNYASGAKHTFKIPMYIHQH